MTSVLISLPWAVVVTVLLVVVHKLCERHDRQIRELCQRIQAPEVAVAQHVQDTVQAPSIGYVPVDDDEAMAEEFRVLNGG